ncbi:hypothetical protein CHARACLAT_013387 [Characodon lateralis]|uniref:Uncharacterized protein n=1 Tax=Characodon lateralis TaxID=208331 RepID=A0ABU7CMV0_9TELE|nr:hypothetical protein [Characodon lateralis]
MNQLPGVPVHEWIYRPSSRFWSCTGLVLVGRAWKTFTGRCLGGIFITSADFFRCRGAAALLPPRRLSSSLYLQGWPATLQRKPAH